MEPYSPIAPFKCGFRKICFYLTAFLFLALLISACGGRQIPGPQVVTTTAVFTRAVTATPSPAAPSTSETTRTVQASPTVNLTSSETPTSTPVPVRTPEKGPEAYRLKPWDQAAALRAIQEAETVPIPEEYEDLRGFYQLSLLYEHFLDFPEAQSDAKFLQQMAELKGLKYPNPYPYGLLHDNAVEPFRHMFERMINDGSIDFASVDQINTWLKPMLAHVENDVQGSTKMINRPGTTAVLKIRKNGGWGFFIVHKEENGTYSVMALHPEWRREWWSEENFQITDLNGNGRDEIALTYDGWGTGMSHFCEVHFNLYEWNGSAFQDLMAEPLEFDADTDYGDCLPIKFVPNPGSASKIQAGTTRYTLCEDMPYVTPIEYTWNGRGFVHKPQPVPAVSLQNQPGRCTIDWALKAGPRNDTAVQLLSVALSNWPKDAEKDWGPAARDYLRLKLATWNIQRGQLQTGLNQLRQVRDHPAAPDYPLPAKVAGTFLDTYQAEGIYRAAEAVREHYTKEIDAIEACGVITCNVDVIRQEWGFAENEWGIEYSGGFRSDFSAMDPLSLELKQRAFNDLETFQTWLKDNRLIPIWSAEGNLDDQGEPDWLMVLEFERYKNNYRHYQLYGFLRKNGRMSLLPFDVYLPEETPNSMLRWESFRPAQGAPLLQVIQTGIWLQVSEVFQQAGEYRVETKFDSADILGWSREDPAKVMDWRVGPGKLTIQYNGRQAEYVWDEKEKKIIPTGYAPDLQDEHVKEAERAIYLDQKPDRAIEVLTNLLQERVWENYNWAAGRGITNPPRVRPYLLYLLGLAYERSGDENNAVKTYWQLWHEYPAYPFCLAVQEKLVLR